MLASYDHKKMICHWFMDPQKSAVCVCCNNWSVLSRLNPASPVHKLVVYWYLTG